MGPDSQGVRLEVTSALETDGQGVSGGTDKREGWTFSLYRWIIDERLDASRLPPAGQLPSERKKHGGSDREGGGRKGTGDILADRFKSEARLQD